MSYGYRRAMRPLFVLLMAALVAGAAPAHADTVQIGSTLAADAAVVETHQQDSMFWAGTIGGQSFKVPADGQITKVWVKGTAIQEPGAGQPLNKVAFQVVRPQADGSMRIPESGGSSAPFDLPYQGDPNQVTTFDKLENLCVKAGDSVAFNNRGGFHYGHGYPGEINEAWYQNGAPFRVFGAVSGSSTFRFTQHNGTQNGMTVSPATLREDTELLMRIELSTGVDASEPCGGPRRHANGECVLANCGQPTPTPQSDSRFQVGDAGDSLQAGTAAANLQVGGGGRDKQYGKGGADIQVPDATTATMCSMKSAVIGALDQLIATYGGIAAVVSVLESMKASLNSMFAGYSCPSSSRRVGPVPLAVTAASGIDDRLFGGAGNDLQDAGPGNDRLNGGPGRDVMLGGSGRDVLTSRDKATDTVSCGTGRDLVLADKRDLVNSDCERVRRR